LKKAKVYLSGPIIGIKNYKRAFERIEKKLEKNGYDPVNPCHVGMKVEIPKGTSIEKAWHLYMIENLKALSNCDSIFMLQGWRNSKDAIIENLYAQALGLSISGYRE
jgi:nucleoside 2-deoxyribosyltransferase